ncbi:hypothetical protein PybrP1_012068 [[Pythium] brassicae (nom. inval.)]|nr:hypothetical protein PybrP1_012068 [[Pythium] brassicae (nom. inval.)]
MEKPEQNILNEQKHNELFINWGKFAGKNILDLLKIEEDYLRWYSQSPYCNDIQKITSRRIYLNLNNNINRIPSNAGSPSNDVDMGEGNNQESISYNKGFYNRLVNHAPVVIDVSESQATFSWPSMGGKSAKKNIAEQTGKNVFKERPTPASGAGVAITIVGSWFWTHKIKLTDLHLLFEKLPLTANCQLKIRIRMNQGKFSVLGNATGYTLTSSIMTSGSTCPLMLASAYTGSPLEGRMVAGTNLEVAYGAIRNELTNPTVEGTDYYPWKLVETAYLTILKNMMLTLAKLSAVNGGLSKTFNCGLLDLNQWSYANRVMIADCSRMTEKDVPASIVVSGVNGSSQGSDLLLLIVYERELEIDILTGEVERLD